MSESTNVRYRFVCLICRLLRHPDRRVVYADGKARTRCPCGHIDMFDRALELRP